jgi:GT2 family glycosyltransferase
MDQARLGATQAGADLPGSPIDIAAIIRTEGVVALDGGTIAGWAWHPGAPETDPELTVIDRAGTRRITATDLSVPIEGRAPLARPRGFRIAADVAAPVRVLGRDGRDLLGSPLGGSTRAPAAPRPSGRPGTAIVIPVYRDQTATLACIDSVRATIGPEDTLLVVQDASPEPALVAALAALAAAGAIRLLSANPPDPTRNVGFPAAANAGMRAAGGRDVVLLNSDTVVYPGWLEALREASHSAPDIGTATPFSNDASIFSVPAPGSAMPDAQAGAALARLALAANPGLTVDVPTGHGFCLYIRADCLHRTGLLRPALFAQGYGEENDFTERAGRLGWRHVAVPGVYVAHQGGASFGAARAHLLRRNAAILDRLHPFYHTRVAAFLAADPLAPARRRLEAARWRAQAAARPGESVLLIAHGGIGGTARVVRQRAAELRAAGRNVVVLRGAEGGATGVDAGDGFPSLTFDLPAELPALAELLQAARPVAAEVHHLRDQDLSVLDLLNRFALPYDVWVHDYLWLCPRLSLVTGEGKFCGEAAAETCVACVARWGDGLERPASAATLRTMSTRLFSFAGEVVVASNDVATRLRRHFPDANLTVRAWEEDPPPRRAIAPPRATPLRVAVVGAIGMEKGYQVLLACARDAQARALPLHFHLVGYTEDDAPLLQTGVVDITGPFAGGEAAALLRASGAHIALLPSIWPETWCYALTDAWRAGLDTAVFDIGTPAERVRRTGRGWVLPLGLPPGRVNDALLNLQALAGRSAG